MLMMPRWLLEARSWLLLFKEIEVMGENWDSELYLPVTGWVRLATSLLSWRLQILVMPSPRPAQINSEFLEKVSEFTGLPRDWTWCPPAKTLLTFACITCTFLPLEAELSTICPSSYPCAIIWLLWLHPNELIFVAPYYLLVLNCGKGCSPVPPLMPLAYEELVAFETSCSRTFVLEEARIYDIFKLFIMREIHSYSFFNL